jgi:hypothetical protein
MNKLSRTLITAALLSSGAAFAQHSDAFCLGNCVLQEAPAAAPLDLCQHRVVREGLVIERKLKPLRDVVGIVQNPTGFVLKQVDAHIVHIPAWVGYAMDPVGSLRAKAMDRVRKEFRKSAGLEKGCQPREGDTIDDGSQDLDLNSWILPRPEEGTSA